MEPTCVRGFIIITLFGDVWISQTLLAAVELLVNEFVKVSTVTIPIPTAKQATVPALKGKLLMKLQTPQV